MSMLPVTVPWDLHDAIAKAAGNDYAGSYLSGAVVSNQKLLPKTRIAWERLRDNPNAMDALRKMGVALVKPPIFTGATSAQHFA